MLLGLKYIFISSIIFGGKKLKIIKQKTYLQNYSSAFKILVYYYYFIFIVIIIPVVLLIIN